MANIKTGSVSALAQVIFWPRFKDENDNHSASINRNIIHKTRERKFKFAFNKLHEALNKLEEKVV